MSYLPNKLSEHAGLSEAVERALESVERPGPRLDGADESTRRASSHFELYRARNIESTWPRRSVAGEHARFVLKRLRAGSGPIWFAIDGRYVAVKLVGTDEAGRLIWEASEPLPQGPVKLVFFGPSAGYHAVLESYGERAGLWTTSIPSRFEPVRFRRDPRFSAPAEVCLTKAESSGERLHQVRDISDRGLSFVCDAGASGIEAGDSFDADVNWMNALRIRLRVNVRHVTPHADSSLCTVGTALTFFTREDESRWHEQVDTVRHPLTRVGKLFTRDMWELFDAAGYFRLSQKDSSEFVSRRESFERTSQLLSMNPDMGVQIVFPSMRGIESAASVIAESEHTAVMYHLAKRPGDDPRGISSKAVLRAVYERALTWMTRRKVKWVSTWIQDVTRFSCGLHRDFAAAHCGSPYSGVFTFRALEIPARPAAEREPGWVVRPAEGPELAGVLAQFWQSYPNPIPQSRAWSESALSQDPERTRPSSVHERFPASSLPKHHVPRERKVVLALWAGRVKAAAILEAALPGLHLYGIFDNCYIARFDDDERSIAPLLAYASSWYHERGKPHFVYASEAVDREIEGARDLGVTHESVFGIELVSKFLEHVWQLTADLP